MKKSIITFFSFLVFPSLFIGQNEMPTLRLSYDRPANEWESEALPIGNGFMGAMIFGGVESDRIQLNEHTLWSGGPGKNASYNGGHISNPTNVQQHLQAVRNELQSKMNVFSSDHTAHMNEHGEIITSDYSFESSDLQNGINGLMGTKTDFGAYQSLSNLYIADPNAVTPQAINISGNCDNLSGNETLAMLFDGNISTKWFSDAGFSNFPCQINWEYDINFNSSSYTLISGNDMPARDPSAWVLYGSQNGINYSYVDSRSDITFSERNQSRSFNFPQTTNYKY